MGEKKILKTGLLFAAVLLSLFVSCNESGKQDKSAEVYQASFINGTGKAISSITLTPNGKNAENAFKFSLDLQDKGVSTLNLPLVLKNYDEISAEIEFDNGKLTSGSTRKVTDAEPKTSLDEIAEQVSFDNDEFDSGERRLYYAKTMKRGENGISDLRNWSLTIPQSDWVTNDLNSDLLSLGEEAGSGKLIRVVATTLSDSLAWERKVIGWFVWWPEADTPWIDAYNGNGQKEASP